MTDHAADPLSPSRRRTLAAIVHSVVVLVSGALTGLLGVFALKPGRGAATDRWIHAGTIEDLTPGVPAPRVLVVPRVDGWYRERAPQTVFLVRDGDAVRAMSATCTHLGCQVHWNATDKHFVCPCHGGVYDVSGKVLDGPPPRQLDHLEARVENADGSVLVRL